jgi:hypothetical protein
MRVQSSDAQVHAHLTTEYVSPKAWGAVFDAASGSHDPWGFPKSCPGLRRCRLLKVCSWLFLQHLGHNAKRDAVAHRLAPHASAREVAMKRARSWLSRSILGRRAATILRFSPANQPVLRLVITPISVSWMCPPSLQYSFVPRQRE